MTTKLVTVQHDPETGAITDKIGTYLGTWTGDIPEPFEPDARIHVSDLVELKRAGYSAKELVQLERAGIIG